MKNNKSSKILQAIEELENGEGVRVTAQKYELHASALSNYREGYNAALIQLEDQNAYSVGDIIGFTGLIVLATYGAYGFFKPLVSSDTVLLVAQSSLKYVFSILMVFIE